MGQFIFSHTTDDLMLLRVNKVLCKVRKMNIDPSRMGKMSLSEVCTRSHRTLLTKVILCDASN